MSRRYTIVVADRQTGALRRFTIRLRPMAAALAFVLAAPVVAGLALRLTAVAEVEHLRTANATLSQENSSYREATGTLATQIESLQAAISELGIRARLDPVSARAMEKLPANIRNQAAGGTTIEGATAMLTSDVGASSFSFSSAQRTFGLLKNVLAGLESHLNIVRSTVEKREALMSATPSIWPIHGWLSAGFGMRPDPFTGQRDFHPGLDISADKGTPILATADGVVDLAAPSGDYGNLVVVNHGYGLVTRYGHLSKFAVWTGKRVQRGEVLGYVGATGRATGPHLHYEIFANGKLMNPMQLLAGKAQD